MKKFPFISLVFLSAVGFAQDWQSLERELRKHREESFRIDLQVERENKKLQLRQVKRSAKQATRQELLEEVEAKKALMSAKAIRVNAFGTVGTSIVTDKGVLYEGMQTPYGMLIGGKVGEFWLDVYGMVGERGQLQIGGTTTTFTPTQVGSTALPSLPPPPPSPPPPPPPRAGSPQAEPQAPMPAQQPPMPAPQRR